METFSLTQVLGGIGVFILWTTICITITLCGRGLRTLRQRYTFTLVPSDEQRRKQLRVRRLNNH